MTAEAILRMVFPDRQEKIAAALRSVSRMSGREYRQMMVDAYNREQGPSDPDYDCSECKNKGFIHYLGDDDEIHCRECCCRVKRLAIRRAKRSGLGELLEKSFERFDTSEPFRRNMRDTAKTFVTDVLQGKRRWFLTCGQSGCGKTHICAAACNELLQHGYEVYYMSWVNEAGQLRRLKTDDSAYNELFNRLVKPEVLYIDDLFKHSGKGEPTDSELGIAFEVLNHRLNSGKITIISTEYTVERLKELDEAVIGRVVEMCGSAIVQVNPDSGKNYRLRRMV